jgi:hypothetical protein
MEYALALLLAIVLAFVVAYLQGHKFTPPDVSDETRKNAHDFKNGAQL